MEYILRNIHFLELLAYPTSNEQASALLATSTAEQLNIISEFALNLLQDRINLSRYYRSKLRKDAEVIRLLADKEVGSKKRRNTAENNLNIISLLLKVGLKHIRNG